MQVNRIDHLVLTVADIERSVEFYSRVPGMRRSEFAGGESPCNSVCTRSTCTSPGKSSNRKRNG